MGHTDCAMDHSDHWNHKNLNNIIRGEGKRVGEREGEGVGEREGERVGEREKESVGVKKRERKRNCGR